jgi:hypothetical protein
MNDTRKSKFVVEYSATGRRHTDRPKKKERDYIKQEDGETWMACSLFLLSLLLLLVVVVVKS